MKQIRQLAFLALASLCAFFPCKAAALSVTDLVANSPFVPTGWSPNAKTPAGTGGEQYIFRGVYSLGEDTFLCISDTSSGKSSWVRLGETSGLIKALSYDSTSLKATILVGSREMTLSMPKPRDNASPVGVAVNSQERDKKRVMPPMRPGARNLARTRANIPPPPWMDRGQTGTAGNRQTGRWNSSGTSSSSESGDSGNSGSGDTGSETGGSTTNPGDTTTDPVESTDPGDDLGVPPSPPSGIPSIPDSIRQMIENGTAPDNPE
jgi:hypothetical protein